MLKFLIYIGLAITPFLFIKGMDSREPKEIFSLLVAASIVLFYLREIKTNKAINMLVAFVISCLVMSFFVPKWIGLNLYAGGNVDGLWNYKTLFFMTIYLLMAITIYTNRFNNNVINNVIKIMFYCGSIMSWYVLLQFIGIDPLMKKSIYTVGHTPSSNLTGTLGNPTIVSVFIACVLFSSLYLKRYLSFFVMLIATCLTQSMMAIGSMCVGLMFYILFNRKLILSIFALVGSSVVAVLLCKGVVTSSGRFPMWITAIEDMMKFQKTFLTGFGIGGWQYIFSPLMHSNEQYWASAHNEYLEVLWGAGIISLLFLFNSIKHIFIDIIRSNDDRVKVFAASLLVLIVNASGNFTFHLGVFCFYGFVLFGLICNLTSKKEQFKCIQ